MSAGVGPQGAGAERQSTYTNPTTGGSATTERAAGTGAQGSGRGVQTTYTNPTTGQTKTYGAAREGNNVYADNNGNVYKNSGSGWQQHTSSGWQSASGDTSWANREQQARSEGEDRFNSFSQSSGGWASRFGGGAVGATDSEAGAGVTGSAGAAGVADGSEVSADDRSDSGATRRSKVRWCQSLGVLFLAVITLAIPCAAPPACSRPTT